MNVSKTATAFCCCTGYGSPANMITWRNRGLLKDAGARFIPHRLVNASLPLGHAHEEGCRTLFSIYGGNGNTDVCLASKAVFLDQDAAFEEEQLMPMRRKSSISRSMLKSTTKSFVQEHMCQTQGQ